MRQRLAFAVVMAAVALSASCGQTQQEIEIIPQPESVVVGKGSFSIKGKDLVAGKDLDKESLQIVEGLATRLSTVTGKEFKVVGEGEGIHFLKDNSEPIEGYSLTVTEEGVEVKASTSAGFRYAIQTLGQMLPTAFYGSKAAPSEKWSLPCVQINDKPRFAYRGMHLDVARHFFPVEEVKKYLDIMAIHKMNRFHWHLTDDQGWRIEIKKYPRLTEVGAWRDSTMVGKQWDKFDHVRHGGFYTQDQIREVVDYAAGLGITIIPEIDLPGHMVAAMASYPELGCTGGPYTVWPVWGVSDQVLCVGKESTFDFIEGVLSEVMELFPSEYIHIGGDECPKKEWERCPACQARIKALGIKGDDNHTAEQYLQSYVTARVQKFVNEHGRRIIGWDEILEGELASGATVMSWRGAKGGIEAAKKGFDVIMTPNTYFYLDYYQSDKEDLEPLAIGGYLPLDTVYVCNPVNDIPEESQKHILGAQANLWTEYIATPEHLEYMLLPRMSALSEVQWCTKENKDFDRFKKSLTSKMFGIYDILGYTYSKDVIGEYGLKDATVKDATETK